MKAALVALSLSLLGLCYFLWKPAPDDDLKRLQGIWIIESATRDGAVVKDIDDEVHFVGNQLTVSTKEGKPMQISSFTLDPTPKPKRLVLVSYNQETPIFQGNCAYELSGDHLMLTLSPPEKRPTEISDKGQVLMTLKRKKR